MRRPTILLLLITPVLAPTASAGGLYVREFGQPAQGTAGAGNGVLLEDASVAFTNPAGLFWLEGDIEWLVTGIAVFGEVEFEPDIGTTIPGNDGGDAGGTVYGGALFHTRRLHDRWGLAVAINSVSGSVLDHDFGFVGRYQAQEVDLVTANLTPSIAYRFSDSVAVSVGVTVQYGRIEYDVAVPPLIGPSTPDRDGIARIKDGDDVSAAVTMSVMWDVSERWNLALGYLGENELDFEGDLSITLPGIGSGTTVDNINAKLGITYPQVLRLGSGFDVSPTLSIFTSVSWENWSELDVVPVTTDIGGSAIPVNWDDTWNVAAGFRWRTARGWSCYGGLSYDSDPTDPQDRLAVLPVDEQWRLSGGVRYERAEGGKLGAVLTYADLGNARLDTVGVAGALVGEYDKSRAIFLGLNFSW